MCGLTKRRWIRCVTNGPTKYHVFPDLVLATFHPRCMLDTLFRRRDNLPDVQRSESKSTHFTLWAPYLLLMFPRCKLDKTFIAWLEPPARTHSFPQIRLFLRLVPLPILVRPVMRPGISLPFEGHELVEPGRTSRLFNERGPTFYLFFLGFSLLRVRVPVLFVPCIEKQNRIRLWIAHVVVPPCQTPC